MFNVATKDNWTDARVEALKSLFAEGLSSSQIARELGGITRNSVIGKVHRLGLKGRVKAKAVKFARNFLTPEAKARNQQDRKTIKVLAVRKSHISGTLKAEMVDAVEPMEETAAPADFLGITFMELENGRCKFPRGEGAGITFCGQTAIKEQPYCRSCHSLAYQPPAARRDNSPAPARFAAGPGAGLRAFRI